MSEDRVVIGDCTLIRADCLDVLPTLPAGSVDAVVTDPPYGACYSTGRGSKLWGDGSIRGDNDTSTRDEALAWAVAKNLPALCFGSWRFSRPIGVRMLLVWDTLGALGMGDLAIPWKPSHQEIYVLGNRHGFRGERTGDVIRHPPVQSMAKYGRIHPMEKPVGLLRLLLEKLRPGTILDPFMGSGTTAVACIQTGRKFIGCEIDDHYFGVAVKRVREAWGDGGLYAEAPAGGTLFGGGDQ